MSIAQKIIKYLALAFAIFLIVTIVSAILTGIYTMSNILGLKKESTENISEVSTLELEKINDYSYLDINIKYSNLKIKIGKKFEVQTNNNNIEVNQKNNKLKIIEEQDSLFWKNSNKEELIVYIPENIEFEKVNIETGAGIVNIEEIKAEKLKLNLGAGETIIKNIISDNVDIDGGAGKFTIENGTINNLDFDLGIGETTINAKITGNNKIDTGIGRLKLNIDGNIDDYKLKVEKGIGNIKLNGKQVSNNTIIGNGENVIDIDGGIGEIVINFK